MGEEMEKNRGQAVEHIVGQENKSLLLGREKGTDLCIKV